MAKSVPFPSTRNVSATGHHQGEPLIEGTPDYLTICPIISIVRVLAYVKAVVLP